MTTIAYHVALPAACSRVILAVDNDGENEGSDMAVRAASEAFAAQGRRVSFARAVTGKDLNDQLRKGGAA